MSNETMDFGGVGLHIGGPGPRGYSAYDIAVQNGYSGTEEEWIASLYGTIDKNLATANVAAEAKATGDAIAAEKTEREAGDTALESKISTEATNRAASDTALENRMNALQSAVGSPLKAATKAAMTDENKIYVYTGSETGMTNGNWYFYDGSDWVSGGVYNAVAINTDTTLTVSGNAADAKTVGDKSMLYRGSISSADSGPDAYVQIGSYYVNQAVGRAWYDLGKYPTFLGSRLTVIGGTGTSNSTVIQIVHTEGNALFYRTHSVEGNVWGGWEEIVNAENLDDVINENRSVTMLYRGSISTANPGPDTYIQIGSYYVNQEVGRTWYDLGLYPTFYGSRLMVIGGAGTSGSTVCQLVITENNALFYRTHSVNGSTWDPWVGIVNTGQEIEITHGEWISSDGKYIHNAAIDLTTGQYVYSPGSVSFAPEYAWRRRSGSSQLGAYSTGVIAWLFYDSDMQLLGIRDGGVKRYAVNFPEGTVYIKGTTTDELGEDALRNTATYGVERAEDEALWDYYTEVGAWYYETGRAVKSNTYRALNPDAYIRLTGDDAVYDGTAIPENNAGDTARIRSMPVFYDANYNCLGVLTAVGYEHTWTVSAATLAEAGAVYVKINHPDVLFNYRALVTGLGELVIRDRSADTADIFAQDGLKALAVKSGRTSTRRKYMALGIVSDIHGDLARYDRFVALCNGAGNQPMAKYSAFDAALCCGDVLHERKTDSEYTYYDGVSGTQTYNGPSVGGLAWFAEHSDYNVPFLVSAGNHDMGGNNRDDGYYTDEEVYNYLIAPSDLVTENGHLYGYYDDGTYKVRIISLCNYDDDYASKTSPSWGRGNKAMYSQAQINWFINLLKSVPDGWTVVVMTHGQTLFRDEAVEATTFYSAMSSHTRRSESYATYLYRDSDGGGMGIISDIVNAYCHRTTISETYAYSGPAATPAYPSLVASADFSDATGDFACYISGHLHMDQVVRATMEGYENQVEVGVTCSSNEYAQTNYGTPCLVRAAQGPYQDALTGVVINTDAKQISVVRIGADTCADGSKHDVIDLSYAVS